jgi:hypothetical protein
MPVTAAPVATWVWDAGGRTRTSDTRIMVSRASPMFTGDSGNLGRELDCLSVQRSLFRTPVRQSGAELISWRPAFSMDAEARGRSYEVPYSSQLRAGNVGRTAFAVGLLTESQPINLGEVQPGCDSAVGRRNNRPIAECTRAVTNVALQSVVLPIARESKVGEGAGGSQQLGRRRAEQSTQCRSGFAAVRQRHVEPEFVAGFVACRIA